MTKKIKLWIKAVRAPFFTATVVSGVMGSVIAWHAAGNFNWSYFCLTIIGIVFLNTGTNLVNDYFDHTSNLDEINKNTTPFSGGSRVIQENLISADKIFYAGLASFALAGAIGLYLNYRIPGNVILFIGIAGVFLGYFYTAEPFRLGYKPVGEIVTGFCCGPLVVCGSYYVQARSLSCEPFLASIPIGILVGLILYINEFQDHDADKQIGKKTLVVLLGKKKALSIYYALLAFVYLWVVIGIAAKFFPYFALVVFITLPICLKACKTAGRNYDKIYELLPANASTIGLHMMIGFLLTGSYVLDKLIKE